ncbi:MAG: RNA-guided endonuclease InsQ/TnpB family protein [Promethearchaeota archaeon]|jgi:IS605 OrfB family transposase
MKLTEQIQLKTLPQLSYLCHLSKNLYNLANYYVRQEYFYLGNWLRFCDLWYMLKEKEAYKKLPSQTAQQTLKLVDKNWKSFFKSNKAYKKRPEKFLSPPRPPRYKKKDGECILVFTNQQCRIKGEQLYFPKKTQLNPIKTRIKSKLHHVRIIPKGLYYILEIIYQKEIQNLNLDKKRVIGIDLGLKNIITIVNNAGLQPAIIKGGIIKSINQFYNKQLAKYRSIKDKQGISSETKRFQWLTRKRNNKIIDIFHKISRSVINYCLNHDFGTIIIGYNKTWKQRITIGKRNNQNFVQIPFTKLLFQIEYKAKLIGIDVILEPESYTSKCSFLDNEPIQKHERYQGRRTCRGLYQSQRGIIINADVNGAYSILKKAVPKTISADGIEGVGLHPYSIAIS